MIVGFGNVSTDPDMFSIIEVKVSAHESKDVFDSQCPRQRGVRTSWGKGLWIRTDNATIFLAITWLRGDG